MYLQANVFLEQVHDELTHSSTYDKTYVLCLIYTYTIGIYNDLCQSVYKIGFLQVFLHEVCVKRTRGGHEWQTKKHFKARHIQNSNDVVVGLKWSVHLTTTLKLENPGLISANLWMYAKVALKRGPCMCSMFKAFNLTYRQILRS